MWYYQELFVLLSIILISISVDLPSNFETCKLSDSDFNGCLKQAIEKALQVLENGIPEINFPVSQPIFIPSMTIGEGKGAVNVVQKFKNLNLYNAFRAKIENVDAKITEKGFDLTVDLFLPHIIVDGEYYFNGRILLLPIVAKGPLNVEYHNLKGHLVLHGEEFQKKGQLFYDIKNLTFGMVPEKITLELKALFNGDKRLGDAMNNVLNENWRAIWNDVKEAYQVALGVISKNIANLIFKKIPHNQIFKE